jgi:hypothetical protein
MAQVSRAHENPEDLLLTNLIQTLSQDRRRELLGEVLMKRFYDFVVNNQAKTIGELWSAVEADPHWSLLKTLRVSDVLAIEDQPSTTPSIEAPAATNAAPPLVVADKPQAAREIVAHSADGRTPREGAKSRVDAPARAGNIIDDIRKLIEASPGLRREEIQERLGRDPELVMATLATLRRKKQVKTQGYTRSMRYFAPSAKVQVRQ